MYNLGINVKIIDFNDISRCFKIIYIKGYLIVLKVKDRDVYVFFIFIFWGVGEGRGELFMGKRFEGIDLLLIV